MEKFCFITFLLLVHFEHVFSHTCLLSPRQRGPLDISTSGNPTCTRHALPCGGQDIEPPRVTYTSGGTAFIQWQQNFNHYEPGYPGYMDISIATTATNTNFSTLAVVTDPYVHAQDHQQNYTAVVKMPDIECDHCVIRLRYNAHKEGEETFLQCSDIKITKTMDSKQDSTLKYLPKQAPKDSRKLVPLKRALRLQKQFSAKQTNLGQAKLYGFAFNPFQPDQTRYVSINTVTGQLGHVSELNFSIDTPDMVPYGSFMMDEVVAVDYGRNTTSILLNTHKDGDRDEVAKRLYNIGDINGTLIEQATIFTFDGSAINALSWYTDGTSVAFKIIPAAKQGSWTFEVGTISSTGMYTKRAAIPSPEGLYVNFQWLDTDVNQKTVYALMGNENAPDALNSRIYTFDVVNGNYNGFVEVDVTKFTFMSMHSYPGSYVLYAFSPGLWNDEGHAWYLVAVNPATGVVTKHCDIAPPGIFRRQYGGSVYQGRTNKSGLLYHVLQVEGSEADFIVAVNPTTCSLQFSQVTNLRHIHSVQMVEQAED